MRLDERHPIFISIIFNIVSVIVKLVIFSSTLSRAVYSEIFHSVGDSLNSVTLFVGAGIYRGRPSPRYPFGLGRVLYISSLFSSIILSGSIFYMIIAENLRIYYGDPQRDLYLYGNTYWIYMLLLTVFDAITMFLSIMIMASREGPNLVLRPLVLEDIMGISGNAMASLSLLLSNRTLDLLISSIIAFIILGGSIHVGFRSIEALIGHSAPKEIVARIIKIALSVPGVVDVNDIKTMIIEPGRYLAVVQIEVKEAMTIKEVEEIKEVIIEEIRRSLPEIRYLILDIVKPREPAKSYISLLKELKEL